MPTKTNGEGVPVVALDIDGTLLDYHAAFLRFAADWIGRPMPDPMDINPGMRLHKFMGVPLATYRECKLAFRQSGLKRSIPPYPGAAELTTTITKLRAEIWIATTRPYLRLDNIDPDTREWLRRAGVKYHAVLFGDQKYAELRRQAGHRVAAIFDDLPKLCANAERHFSNAHIYIRDQPYNRYFQKFPRVYNCADIQDRAIRAIEKWRESWQQ